MSSSKTTEALDISVDELALSLVGWQVEEAQARLLTESWDDGDLFQKIAVSHAFRFLPEDWTDRFEDSGNDDYAPSIFITLNRHDIPAPLSKFEWILLDKIKKAKKGLIRVSAKSDDWMSQSPLAAKDLDLRLTAYDLCSYTGDHLSLPSPTTIPLEIIVMDETSTGAPRPNVTVAHAYLSKVDGESSLTVHIEGTFQFGSAEDLLNVHRDRGDWEDLAATVKNTAPFKVAVPEIGYEVLDDTGFLLYNASGMLSGHIPVDEQGNVPRRQPRWICGEVLDLRELPGDPHRVVVRVTDGEEL